MGFGIFDALSSTFGSKEELYGKKPIVPSAPDYVASLKKITKGNIDLIPSLSELSTKSTKLYSDLLELSSPGTTARKEKVGSIIDDMLSGKVPADVQRQLEQFGAARASTTGVGGDIGGAWTAQDFGTTSYAIQQQGVTAASRWLEQSRAGIFDFSKMFFGPEIAVQQADANFNRDWLSNQVDAAPDPAVRGAFDTEMAGFGMLLSIYGGGAGYTGKDEGGGGGGGIGGWGPTDDSNADYMGGRSSFFNTQEREVNSMRPMNSY